MASTLQAIAWIALWRTNAASGSRLARERAELLRRLARVVALIVRGVQPDDARQARGRTRAPPGDARHAARRRATSRQRGSCSSEPTRLR